MWKGYMVDIRYDMQYREQDDIESALIDSDGDEQSQPSSIHFPEEQQEPPTPTPRERVRDRMRQVCVICHLSYSCKSSLDLHMRRNHSQSNSCHTGFVPRQYRSQFGDQQQQKPPSTNQPFSYKREYSESASQHPSARQENSLSRQLQASQEQEQYSRQEHSPSRQQQAFQQHSSQHSYASQNPSTIQHSEGQDQFKKHICGKCGAGFAGKGSLRVHIRSRHPEWQQGLIVKPHPHTKTKMSQVQCPKCGQIIHSKTALEIHDANKHKGYQPKQPFLNPVIPGVTKPMMDVQEAIRLNVQQCGCGNVYKSRSALNLHIRRKHFGKQPQGTIKHLSSVRPRGVTIQDVRFNNQVENYLRAQRQQSEKEEESIYDSDCEDGPKMEKDNEIHRIIKQEKIAKSTSPPQIPKQLAKTTGPPNIKPTYPGVQPVIERGRELYKPFKCGCGKNYTVSSSLNLHIKKAHNWVIPLGTIGGPRGLMGGQDEGELINKNNMYHRGQKAIICSECGEPQDNTHFECQTCLNHILCSTCFWATNNVNREHTWITRDRS